MLSKHYESTEVDRRTWLHVPSGTHWSTSSDTHQVVEIIKETSTKMYTPFEIGLNYNMGHMRISGTEPLQWSLAKQSSLKYEKWCKKVPKQGKAKKGWCNKPTILQFQGVFNTENSSSNQKTTETNQMYRKACEKKCCYCWFNSEVKFLMHSDDFLVLVSLAYFSATSLYF